MLLRRLSATHVPRWIARSRCAHQAKIFRPKAAVPSCESILAHFYFYPPTALPSAASPYPHTTQYCPPCLQHNNPNVNTVHSYNIQKQPTTCLRSLIKDTTTNGWQACCLGVSSLTSAVSSSHLHIETSRPPTSHASVPPTPLHARYRDALRPFHMSNIRVG